MPRKKWIIGFLDFMSWIWRKWNVYIQISNLLVKTILLIPILLWYFDIYYDCHMSKNVIKRHFKIYFFSFVFWAKSLCKIHKPWGDLNRCQIKLIFGGYPNQVKNKIFPISLLNKNQILKHPIVHLIHHNQLLKNVCFQLGNIALLSMVKEVLDWKVSWLFWLPTNCFWV